MTLLHKLTLVLDHNEPRRIVSKTYEPILNPEDLLYNYVMFSTSPFDDTGSDRSTFHQDGALEKYAYNKTGRYIFENTIPWSH